MKKAAIAVSALLAVGAGATIAPGYVGDKAKSDLDTLITELNESPQVDITWDSYTKDWWSSEGVLNIRTDIATDPGQAPMIVEFKTHITAQHGPVILHDGLKVAWTSWQSTIETPAEWDQTLNLQGQPITEQTGQVNLLGSISYQEVIPPMEYTSPSGSEHIVFDGFQGSGEYSGKQFTYQGQSKNLTLTSAAERNPVVISDLKLDIDAELTRSLTEIAAGSLYSGQFRMKAGNVSAGEKFQASGLGVALSSVMKDNDTLADVTLSYSADLIMAEGTQLTDANIDISLINYSDAFNQAYTKVLQDAFEKSDDFAQADQLMLQALKDNVPALVAAKPELRFDNVQFTLPEGTFKSEATVKLSTDTASFAQMNSPLFWRNNLVLDVYADADKALATKLATTAANSQLDSDPQTASMSVAEREQMSTIQANMMLGMFQGQGFLVEKDDKLSFKLNVADGQPLVNGKSMPLPF